MTPPRDEDFVRPNISVEKLAYIIEKAREYDAEVPADEDELGSDEADDDERQILLDTSDNPTAQELRDGIESLNMDEQEVLLAMMWVGRGDFGRDEWADALNQARRSRNAAEPDYLMGTPMLGDYLEEAASLFGMSLDDEEMGRE